MALDAKLRLKEARKTRFAKFDAKRKGMVDDLEEREKAFKKAKLDKEAKQKEMWRENEKIMEEGRILREQREKELRRREEEAEERERRVREEERNEFEPPALGEYTLEHIMTYHSYFSHPGTLDTTVRLKYPISSHPHLITANAISTLLSPFGAVDSDDIVMSIKPPPPKKPKRVVALVPFKQVGDASAVVCASGREDRGLKDVEVAWAEGKEPELIGWLKRIGKLGSQPTKAASSPSTPSPEKSSSQSADTSFSSFPSTFVSLSVAFCQNRSSCLSNSLISSLHYPKPLALLLMASITNPLLSCVYAKLSANVWSVKF